MKVNFDVEYYEYECSGYCTENGCMGHVTDIPIAIIIDGTTFYIDGFESGDFPNSFSKDEIEGVKNSVKRLEELCTG